MSRRLLTVAALALAVAAGIAWALSLDYLSDDTFISFRYARNLARGDGLVFNPSERVEGYTNFLEVVVLAGLYRLGADLVRAGRSLSLASGAASSSRGPSPVRVSAAGPPSRSSRRASWR